MERVTNSLSSDIDAEYLRWMNKVGEEDPYRGDGIIGIHHVLKAHFYLIEYFARRGERFGGVGPRDLNLLHSALARQHTSFDRVKKWKKPLEVAATLYYGLIMNHPFHDCNKRTAFLVALNHLNILGRCPKVRQREFENLAVATADHKLSSYPVYADIPEGPDRDVQFIAYFFKSKTREVDKRFYSITYNELSTILKQYGFQLLNPADNHIDIVKPETTKSLLKGTRTIYKKIGQIGFPGWKSPVGQGAISTVRHKTGLTPENGYDSEVFYNGLDPIFNLIKEYEGPLKRLADR